MGKSNYLRNVHHSEFLVSDGECKVYILILKLNWKILKAIVIMPLEILMDIGQEYSIMKSDIFWNGG